ncbi:LapA family protein [Psychrobium sp. nBUS_13]|jgi:putative membrane protein|uniref:LapA family protein n=1 Tax=Psychrobium sp. nBUS_13 TaxID=3395319 RepID=UPI003EBC8E74
MKVVLTTMIVIVFFTIAVLFGAVNNAMVDVNYLVGQGSFNISVALGITFVSGFTICWIIFYSMYLQLKLKLALTHKKLAAAQSDDTSIIVSEKA